MNHISTSGFQTIGYSLGDFIKLKSGMRLRRDLITTYGPYTDDVEKKYAVLIAMQGASREAYLKCDSREHVDATMEEIDRQLDIKPDASKVSFQVVKESEGDMEAKQGSGVLAGNGATPETPGTQPC